MHGISAETIAQTLRLAVGGLPVDLVHQPREKEDVALVLELPRPLRSRPEDLLALRVRSGDANALPEPGGAAAPPLVPLRELVTVEHTLTDKSIYHKNLMPVTYVIGDVAGVIESPVYAILRMNKALRKLDARKFVNASSSYSSREKEPEAPTSEQATQSDASNSQPTSFMADEVASLLISRMAMPVLYYMVPAQHPPCQRLFPLGSPPPKSRPRLPAASQRQWCPGKPGIRPGWRLVSSSPPPPPDSIPSPQRSAPAPIDMNLRQSAL
ncbi:MAG: efflux RND transporter permease subunit [Verrucomicrobiales bacterium]|nr:efflux RND transporter permease subunit [Verrucomicrobiales bacterium]